MPLLARKIVSAALLSLPVLLPASVYSQDGPHCRDGESCRDRGPRRWSEDWYSQKGCSPVGTRQHCRCGQLWPPYARPTGEHQECSAGFHANHYWPYPYMCRDRAAVHQVLDLQTANGWMMETTLYDYHFDPETNRLTKAGELQLQWILHQVPPQHRAAYVQLTADPVSDRQRLAHVRETALALVGAENLPPVYARYATPNGRPAREINAVRQMELVTQPAPRIIYMTTQSGGNTNSAAPGGTGGQQ